MNIHPSAVVSEGAKLDENVVVGPYSIIEDGTSLGDGSSLLSHAIVRRGTLLGRNCAVHAGAVLGGEPQDVGFPAERETWLRIGDHCVIRENVTLSRASKENEYTVIGNRCFFMAGSHVAHDCVLGDNVVLANNALLGGFVSVGANAFFGGGAAVHQFCRIGEGTMIGGYAAITQDVPPFCMVAERNRLVGLNLVGLKRRGATPEVISNLKKCFHAVYAPGNPRDNALRALSDKIDEVPEARRFLEFFDLKGRGFARPKR